MCIRDSIDSAKVERIAGYPIRVERDPGQRPACGCAASVDIGVYNTCLLYTSVRGAAGNGIGGLSAVYAEKDWINRKLFPSTGGISKKNVL